MKAPDKNNRQSNHQTDINSSNEQNQILLESSKISPAPSKSKSLSDLENRKNSTSSTTTSPAPPPIPMPFAQQKLHSLLSLLFSDSPRRIHGRNGSISAFALKYDNGETKSYYVINLYYQMCVGAIGGVTCGIETNHFMSPAPIPVRFLSTWSRLTTITKNSHIIRRMVLRAAGAGLLFDLLDKNIQQYRQKKDWMNFASAGFISGLIFGSRGGFRGCLVGSLGFGGFAAMAGFFDDFFKKHF